MFDVTKRYEVEYNQQFIDYLENQFLKIDFIDESVDFTDSPESSDYIGSARHPLKDLLTNKEIKVSLPIVNQRNTHNGEVTMMMKIQDLGKLPGGVIEPAFNKPQVLQNEIINKEVEQAVAVKLAQQGLNDLEACLDPLFMKSHEYGCVKQAVFKEYVLSDLKTGIRETDIDLYLRSHPVFSRGAQIFKLDLLKVLDEPFR